MSQKTKNKNHLIAKKLTIENFARVKKGELEFGNLTILVGPQATGKTLTLELLKLIIDSKAIVNNLKKYPYNLTNDKELESLFFGKGLNLLKDNTRIKFNGYDFAPSVRSYRGSKEKIFYIPAHRVMAINDGWPQPFQAFSVDDPYVLRIFSENIRILLERMKGNIFPIEGRFNKTIRDKINDAFFGNAKIIKGKEDVKRKLFLEVDNNKLQFFTWSAGQREFVPLLLGLYFLLPSGNITKQKDIDAVVIEEPEMGLHPKAIETIFLLILELLRRKYQVIISTHSPQILEMVWVLQELINQKRKLKNDFDKLVKEFLGINNKQLINTLKENFKIKIHFFTHQDNFITIKDITNLEEFENTDDWGGLTKIANKSSEIVSRIYSGNYDI